MVDPVHYTTSREAQKLVGIINTRSRSAVSSIFEKSYFINLYRINLSIFFVCRKYLQYSDLGSEPFTERVTTLWRRRCDSVTSVTFGVGHEHSSKFFLVRKFCPQRLRQRIGTTAERRTRVGMITEMRQIRSVGVIVIQLQGRIHLGRCSSCSCLAPGGTQLSVWHNLARSFYRQPASGADAGLGKM